MTKILYTDNIKRKQASRLCVNDVRCKRESGEDRSVSLYTVLYCICGFVKTYLAHKNTRGSRLNHTISPSVWPTIRPDSGTFRDGVLCSGAKIAGQIGQSIVEEQQQMPPTPGSTPYTTNRRATTTTTIAYHCQQPRDESDQD